MNSALYLTLFLALFFGPVHCPGSEIPDINSASVEDVRNFLDSSNDRELYSKLVENALGSERSDIIQLLFANPSTGAYLPRSLEKVADARSRDKSVLLLLQSDSINFWPHEEESSRVMVIWHYDMIRPFIPTFQRHLPYSGPLLEILRTKESRLQVAAELEAAMIQSQEAASKGADLSLASVDSSGAAQSSGPAKASTISPVSSQADEVPKIIWVVLALITGGLIWWALRRPRNA